MGIGNRAGFLSGALLLAALGRDRFYMKMQESGILGWAARKLVTDRALRDCVEGQRYIEENIDNPRRSQASIELYCDASLGGYGLPNVNAGDQHLPVEQQLRGAVFPLVQKAFAEYAQSAVEIGAGNGDALAWLATQNLEKKFTGVDFHLLHARRHIIPNLTWMEGYPLELLETRQLQGDILIASSTLCATGPKEMEAYSKAISDCGFRTIIIRDMLARGYSPDRYPGRSRHMRKLFWGHDYKFQFNRYGFRTTHFEIQVFSNHAKSPKIYQQVLRLDR